MQNKRKGTRNMKKWIALLLAAVLVLSLAACSGQGSGDSKGGNPSDSQTDGNSHKENEEDVLENAQELDLNELNEKVMDNMASANSAYVGNTYQVGGYITEITGEYCAIASSVSSQVSLHVYLKEEDLAKVHQHEYITVAGKIPTDFVDASSMPVFAYYADMKPASLVSDTYQLTGEIKNIQTDLPTPLCQIGATAVFLDADTLNTLKVGDTVTVEGKMYWDDSIISGAWTSINEEVSFHLKEAVIAA